MLCFTQTESLAQPLLTHAMIVIRPHCRLHFTAADVDFILKAVGRGAQDSIALRELLTDEGSRDQLLDSPELYRAVLESAGCLTISPHLYFYVLVRHALNDGGVPNREVADYVAELLAAFTRTEQTRARLPGESQPLDCFVEMLEGIQRADARHAFALRAHMGNQALYYCGLFNDRIDHRARLRGFPGIAYYEGLGESSFAAASHDRWAARLGLSDLFALLSHCFHRARLALNSMADRLVSLGDGGHRIDHLLITPAP